MKKLFIILGLLVAGVCNLFAKENKKYARQGNTAYYNDRICFSLVITDYYDVPSEVRERYDFMLGEDFMKFYYNERCGAAEVLNISGGMIIEYIKYNGEDNPTTTVRLVSSPPHIGVQVAVKFVGNKNVDDIDLKGDILDDMRLFNRYDLDVAWNKLKQKYNKR